jgi:hypothetical protein
MLCLQIYVLSKTLSDPFGHKPKIDPVVNAVLPFSSAKRLAFSQVAGPCKILRIRLTGCGRE